MSNNSNLVAGVVIGALVLIILFVFFQSMNASQEMPESPVSEEVEMEVVMPTMHPSWDADGDGINDCEAEGICDDSVDYTLPRP